LLQALEHTQLQVSSSLASFKPMKTSNKTIFERSIGRPAMMAFVFLCGAYLTTGHIIPGIV
jgi:hypothetical protein